MKEAAPPQGNLFTVVVRGPGRARWGVVVRAPDEAAARANIEARGQTVEAVRCGIDAGLPATRLVHGECVRCGYSLLRLPPGTAGEVMCPECGVINVPTSPMDERRERLIGRSRRVRIAAYLLLAIIVTFVLVAAML